VVNLRHQTVADGDLRGRDRSQVRGRLGGGPHFSAGFCRQSCAASTTSARHKGVEFLGQLLRGAVAPALTAAGREQEIRAGRRESIRSGAAEASSAPLALRSRG